MAKTMAEIKEAFQDIREQVDGSGEVKSFQMWELRDAVGAGRLDQGPLVQIEQALAQQGLAASSPTTRQYSWTLVYVTQSQIGRVIRAAAGTEEDDAESLVRAVKAYTSDEGDPRDAQIEDLRETLAQVKAIVSAFE